MGSRLQITPTSDIMTPGSTRDGILILFCGRNMNSRGWLNTNDIRRLVSGCRPMKYKVISNE